MGYRLTLPGGAVVETESAEQIRALLAALVTAEAPAAAEAAAPSKWKPNRPNGRGSIETSGKYGYRWSVMIAAKRHVGPTVGSEAEAEASLAEFLRTGVMPPKPPRAAYRCGNCFGSGHTVKRCPQRPARGRAAETFEQDPCAENINAAPDTSFFAASPEVEKEEGCDAASPDPEPSVKQDAVCEAEPDLSSKPPRKPTACGVCGAPGHNARGHAAHEAAVASLAAPPAPPETFVPPPEVRLAAPTERATRTRWTCKACGGLGHRRNNCPDAVREPKAPKKGATPPREIEPSAELGPIAVRAGDRFTVVEELHRGGAQYRLDRRRGLGRA